MKQNNYIGLWIALISIELAWSIAATVVCVKQDQKVRDLEKQVTEYKNLYHGCLQGKMRLQNMKIVSDRDVVIEFEK